ncbi:MAG: hypothetical protein LBB59_00035 [Campylobacteraceae bacterium]|jgi:hypothetical protein|nr:hypothetical protein [Campylobacteraceae bacterium]
MIITITNADDKLLKTLKNIIKPYSTVKIEVKKEKTGSVKKALEELKNKEYETFPDFQSYKKAMRSNV